MSTPDFRNVFTKANTLVRNPRSKAVQQSSRATTRAGQHRTIRLEVLPGRHQSEPVEAARRGQIRANNVTSTRRGLSDGLRRNLHHRETSTPTQQRHAHPDYPLNCEDPLMGACPASREARCRHRGPLVSPPPSGALSGARRRMPASNTFLDSDGRNGDYDRVIGSFGLTPPKGASCENSHSQACTRPAAASPRIIGALPRGFTVAGHLPARCRSLGSPRDRLLSTASHQRTPPR